MSNFLSLLPLALDAGSPQETDRAVAPKTKAPASLPIPPAWLEPQPEPAKNPRTSKAMFTVMLALFLGAIAVDFFTPPATHAVTTTQDGACPAQ